MSARALVLTRDRRLRPAARGDRGGPHAELGVVRGLEALDLGVRVARPSRSRPTRSGSPRPTRRPAPRAGCRCVMLAVGASARLVATARLLTCWTNSGTPGVAAGAGRAMAARTAAARSSAGTAHMSLTCRGARPPLVVETSPAVSEITPRNVSWQMFLRLARVARRIKDRGVRAPVPRRLSAAVSRAVKPRMSCAASSGTSSCGAVADAVELDPVGVREPLVAKARGGRRPRQEPVAGAPHDAHRAGDGLRVELVVALAQAVLDQRRRAAARSRARASGGR